MADARDEARMIFEARRHAKRLDVAFHDADVARLMGEPISEALAARAREAFADLSASMGVFACSVPPRGNQHE